jgi:hypothetical protein
MKKGIPVILVGLAGVVAQCIAFPHLLKIGTCASGGPYVIANPCPSGTATWILLIGGGMTVSILCIVAASFITSGGLFSGAGLVLWSAEFLGLGLALLLTAIFGHNLSGGAKSAGYSVGIIFIPMGGLPLLFGIKGWITGAENKLVTRRARTADATISRVDELRRYGTNQARVKVTYAVQPSDGASFEVSRETNAIVSHMPQFGDRAKISYDPRHPDRFEVVSAGVSASARRTSPPPATVPTMVPIPGIPGGASALPWASSLLSAQSSNGGDPVGRLKQLADLHSSGALTDAEFQLEKSKILAEP